MDLKRPLLSAAMLAGFLALCVQALPAEDGLPPGEEEGFSYCRPEYKGPSSDEERNRVILEFWASFYGKLPKDCTLKDTRKCGVPPGHVFQWEIHHGCEGHPDCQAAFAALFNAASSLVVRRKRLRCDKKAREYLLILNQDKRNLGKWIKCEWRYCHGGMTCLTGPGFRYPLTKSLTTKEEFHVRGPWFCGDFLCDEQPVPQNGDKPLVNPCPHKRVYADSFCRTDEGDPVTWRGGVKAGFDEGDGQWGSASVCRKNFDPVPRPSTAQLKELIKSAAGH